jgi:carbonic anhydrase/acetyltransferase-like protein (isoleucine patch superfamily)
MNNLRSFRGIVPRLGARVYVDPAATVIGDVELADDASIWPGAVARGDVHFIRIGARSNVQDGATVKKHGFVGAGSVIPPGKVVGERELWLGNPARMVRVLSDAQVEALYYSAANYVRLKDTYLAEP